jgi:hypothetical protein
VGEKVFSKPDDWGDFAPFQVQRVLKGPPVVNPIQVAVGWYCGTGVEAALGHPHVLFLNERRNKFYTVSGGCAVRSLPIIDGRVDVGEVAIPVDVLAESLGLQPPAKTPRCWPWASALIAILCSASAALGFVFGRRRRPA